MKRLNICTSELEEEYHLKQIYNSLSKDKNLKGDIYEKETDY